MAHTTFLRAPEGLEPGEHACLVYDDDARRDAALLTFLGEGLDRGERVLYLARTPDDPLATELSARARDGQFEAVTSEDAYCRRGRSTPSGRSPDSVRFSTTRRRAGSRPCARPVARRRR